LKEDDVKKDNKITIAAKKLISVALFMAGEFM